MSVNYRVKQRLQAALAQQSGGLLGLVNLFKKFDTDGSGSLSWEEFCSALQKCGLAPSPQDIRAIFLDLDKDGNNEISYQEFVHVMRGDMSNQRKALIKRVFDSIDEDGDGVISMTDLGKAFNPKNHPEVRSGRLTVNNLLKDFFESFSSVSNTGYVNLAQFMEYYANSAAFEDDIKFMDTMNSIWTIKSGGKSANTGNVKNLSSVTSSSIGSLISGGEDGVTSHLNQLREQLKTRGARGFIGLQRKFKIMDDDGNGNLNLVEFKKGIKESGLNLTDLQISQLFSLFDRDRSGTVDFDEFLVTVRGSLNPKRKRLIQMAFDVLDKNGTGEVDPEDLVGTYNASKHPDVLSGRRTEDQILREFLDTFDVGGVKDGVVTREEFENYYANISASIDDDDYFELMIRNAWHISGGEGWAANSANRRVLVTHQDGRETVEEIKNDLGLRAGDKEGMMARLKAQGVNATNLSAFGSAGDKTQGFSDRKVGFKGVKSEPQSLNKKLAELRLPSDVDKNALSIAEAGPSSGGSSASALGSSLQGLGVIGKSSSGVPNAGLLHIVAKLKSEIRSRGGLGFVALQRKFRIMDDDGNKVVDLSEFKKAMKEMNINISDSEQRMLFEYFDTDNSGGINFEEFIQGVRDPLSDRRLRLVQLAFSKLDKDGNGIVDAAEVASAYDASRHPEVIAGRMTAKEVMNQFLETFDVGGVKDGMVSQQEFINYYTNLGANIDNDDYFELMIRNAWHISGGEGWSANSANRRVLVTHEDGSETVEEIKNDLGLRAGDKEGMMARLKAQGVNSKDISMYGGVDNTTAAKREGGVPLGNLTKTRGIGNNSSLVSSALKPQEFVKQSASSVSALGDILGGKKSSVSGANSTVIAQVAPPLPPNSERFISTSGPSAVLPPAPPASANLNHPPAIMFLVNKMKVEMKQRGALGFIGLQRKFKIMDDDNNKTLSLAEFKKAMKEMNFNLSDSELRMLFDYFDSDHNGGIDFEEFIQGVRDPLNERRLKLVIIAFGKLDVDGNGIVDAAEVASKYDASRHPDVLSGRKTPNQVLTEFLDTFDVGGVKDGMVSQQEFINYYTNLGANIDNDDYFELMIRNAWHISGGEGWSANSANRRVLVTHEDGSETVEEIKNDLGLRAGDKEGMMARLKAQGVSATKLAIFGSAGDESKGFGDSKKRFSANHFKSTIPAGVLPGTGPVSPAKAVVKKIQNPQFAPVGVRVLIDKLRSELKVRGAIGFIGLQRKFRIMDDDNNKVIDLGEFKKAMKETNLNLSDSELRILFDHFDADGSGGIDFEEFIQGVRDPLTERRLNLVKLAFNKLDIDGNGIIDAAEVASKYDASRHPEVIAGRMTAKEVMNQFLETFDVGGVKDGMVSQQEFINYYTNLGANIDNDDYFELMIRNAWHISGGEGWSANSANRRVLVTHEDGSETVEEIKNDLGLRAGDKEGMMARLKAQGVNSKDISMYGGVDNTTAAKREGGVPLGNLTKTRGIGNNSSLTSALLKSSDAPQRGSRPSSSSSSRNGPPSYGVQVLVDRLKVEIRKRGATGFLGLQRKFKIIDDDGDKILSLGEFKKAMKEMNLNLSDSELRILFDHFDADGSGGIDFEEFIQGVRDPLTERRLNLVKLAFNKLDKDGNGIVEAGEVASAYDASRHPEVIAGRMTAKEVMSQFLETFDVGGVKDGMVSQQEFINYYTNLGANIDNDDYFELMIRNAWHISGGEGWSANSANRRVLVTHEDGSETVEEIKNDLGLRADDRPGMIAKLRAQGTNASQISLFGGADYTQPAKRPGTAPANVSIPNAALKSAANRSSIDLTMSTSKARPSTAAPQQRPSSAASLASAINKPKSSSNVEELLQVLRAELNSRGARGIVGIQRKFRIIDDDGDHTLSLGEFNKAMKETGLNFSQEDTLALFKYFDTDGSGGINFDEFLNAVRGPMNEKRKRLVQLAFNVLDRDGDGEVEPDELIGRYDAAKHPDVISGKRSEEDILREFLETFDVGGVKDGVVTREEFINYYNNISASVDNDDYFELMIRNAWHISGGEGWAANSANRRVLVTHDDGRETVEEIKNDLGLRAGDKEGMMARLKAQGVNSKDISMYGGYDDTNQSQSRARGFGQRAKESPYSQTGGRIFGKTGDAEKPGRRSLAQASQITLG